VIDFDERADDGPVGHRRLPIEGSAFELHCDARGGPLRYRGLSPGERRPRRSFSAFSAARRFFSCLSRFGPFCFGTVSNGYAMSAASRSSRSSRRACRRGAGTEREPRVRSSSTSR
jgi:hypothetical protein